MTEHAFGLIPFPNGNIPDLTITGRIAHQKDGLTVQYFLTGALDHILLPQPVPHRGRREELWLATCFEFFLALPDQPQYWEFNLSPSGEWNCFHMDAYRRVGFREEGRIAKPRIQSGRDVNGLRLEAVVDLSPILETGVPIQAGITSVIQTHDGHESYWALVHPLPYADFHIRESFILAL